MAAESQQLVVDLCHKLHSRREALIPGTGVALKQGDQVFIPPADVHLDCVEAEDIFTFNCNFDSAGNPDLSSDATNPCHNISAYTNLFLKLFQEFDCGCVFYAQPKSAVVVGEMYEKYYKIKNNQLITQISNGETKEQYPWTHELKIPIIANPDDQTILFLKLEKAFEANPQTNAVIIQGNGLFVCGDTWQETKLMFETFLQLFEVSIEIEKIKGIKLGKEISLPEAKKARKVEIKEIEVIKSTYEKKPITNPKAPNKYLSNIKQNLGGSSTKFGRGGGRDSQDLAFRRKKMALARLRMNNGGQEIRASTGRMNAASFMHNNGPSQSVGNGFQNMAMGNQACMTIGMGNDMNMGMANGNEMNMGMNQMNTMNMNQGNNMMQENQGNMDMMRMENQGNMNMNQQMFNNGVGDMANQGYIQDMHDGSMVGMNQGRERDMRDGRSSGLYGTLSRGNSRGNRTVSPRRGRGFAPRGGRGARGSRGAGRGNVKERLGFKSNISVDPSELINLDVNEEDY